MRSGGLLTSQAHLAALSGYFLGVIDARPFSLVLLIWHLLLIGAVALVLVFWLVLAWWVIVHLVRSTDKNKGKPLP